MSMTKQAAAKRQPRVSSKTADPVIWYNKLSYLAVAIILWKTISVFDGYWWEETSLIATLAIFAAALVEIAFPPGFRAVKTFFQAIVSLLIIAVIATAYGDVAWQSVPREEGGAVRWLELHFAALSPFIWICAALLLIYMMFIRWAVTRTRLFAVLSASLLTLTVADSFTPVWLWDDVAWVVLTGLLWLVANHLASFQSTHPGSWIALLRSPVQLFVPVAAVLAVVMTGGLVMPSISPVLQDPYTIWKQSKGETVQTFIGEKAISNTPVLPNSDSSSGYSRSDQSLGGGFNYDYSPVMTVQSTERSYWRGETKDYYSGGGWRDSEETGDPGDVEIARVRLQEQFYEEDGRELAETVRVDQTVTMIREDAYPVLFGASPLSTVNWVNDPEATRLSPRLYWSAEDAEVRLYDGPKTSRTSYDVDYPDIYSVTSEIVLLNEDALRETRAGWDDPAKGAQYLQLPDNLPQRVKDLAEEVTAGASNDYDKAKMIEQYLRTAYPYTNQPDMSRMSLSLSTDFVDQFLFELMEGYCDYFSTAMAVMGRTVGLPTRWVKGFAPGALPVAAGPEGMGEEVMPSLNPDGSGTYTVRNSDAHSWVEVYFEGFGWIPFEPTSGFSYPYSVPETEAVPLPSAAPEEKDTTEAKSQEEGNAIPLSLIGWIAAGVLAAAAAVWAFVRRGAIAAAWEQYRFRSFSANDRIVWETERLLRKCKRKGLTRGEHETLREAVSRWSGTGGSLKKELHEVLDGFEKAKYSQLKATSDDAERFTLKVRAIIEQVK